MEGKQVNRMPSFLSSFYLSSLRKSRCVKSSGIFVFIDQRFLPYNNSNTDNKENSAATDAA